MNRRFPSFYWLPPMVTQPVYGGTFDAELSPTVEICELVGDACGPVLRSLRTLRQKKNGHAS